MFYPTPCEHFTAFSSPSTALPAVSGCGMEPLATLSNEAHYAALVASQAPLDSGLEILVTRLRPIIFNIARDYLSILSWDDSDALQEARILLWQLVIKRRYKPGSKAPFHTFFSRCYRNRLNNLYRDYLLRNPMNVGSVTMGWEGHEPIILGVVRFNSEYVEKYRAAQSVRNRKLYDKKRAAAGKKPREVLTVDQKAAREAEKRRRAAERTLVWQRENREAYNKRRAEIRREKAAGTFVDRRRKGVCAPAL